MSTQYQNKTNFKKVFYAKVVLQLNYPGQVFLLNIQWVFNGYIKVFLKNKPTFLV